MRNAVFDLKYHMIWCTKYRYKILRGRVAERARDLIRQICQARDVVIGAGPCRPIIFICCCQHRQRVEVEYVVEMIRRQGVESPR